MRTSHAWHSECIGERMQVVRIGRSGRPILYLPSSSGNESEFERYRFVDVVAPWVESGRIQVFAADGRGPASWWNDALTPAERVRTYARFEEYVRHELVPWILSLCGADTVAAVGPSYGAFVAANLFLKVPESVALGCGFGGVYGLWHRLDGHHDDDVYFHTPLEFLPRLHDPAILETIRAGAGFDLFAAANDSWLHMSERMCDVLVDRGVPHTMEVWGPPADHHEHWWGLQLARFLERRFGRADGRADG